ncbi:MAG TPA: hypothetical protein VJZ00_02400 [Thermoanaerobaculia bacterium]|nr:hypothetical protein [Thermoanaerobaculia bacterium]
MATTNFKQVKQYLDDIIAQWAKKNGRQPDLPGVHGDPNMGWATKDQLINSAPFGMQLIVPGTPGKQTNLYVALTEGVPGFPQMPDGGPYMSADQTNYIAKWIDEGMPD